MLEYACESMLHVRVFTCAGLLVCALASRSACEYLCVLLLSNHQMILEGPGCRYEVDGLG